MELQQLAQGGSARYGSVPEREQTESVSAQMMSDSKYLHGCSDARNLDRISRYLDNGYLGAAIDVFMFLVSLVFAAMYICNTYIPANDMPGTIWAVELVCSSFFTVDFAFRGVYLSNRRKDYLLSLASVVQIVCIVPVLPVSFFVSYHTLWYGESWWRFVYPVRFAMCYMEGKAVLSRCHAYLTPVRQFAFLCYLQLTCIIAGAAGIIQIAETMDGELSVENLGEWTFFNAFFNSVMTFVTIDTPPANNALTKVFVGILVCVFILIIPYQISNVMSLSNSFSTFQEASYKPTKSSRHIVLCGDLTPSRIDHFFREIFHDDHDLVDIHVVVLSEEAPPTSLIALLMDPFFDKRARFLQGSLLNVDDAKRAACDSAEAIFILTRRIGEESPSSSDHRALMRVLAAKRLAPKAVLFAQLHLSVHCALVRSMGVENVLCLSETVLSLLGQNCVCPGFSTFIYGLTSTSSFDGEDGEGLRSDSKRETHFEAVDRGTGSWVDRYLLGTSHEVYSADLPPASIVGGKTFSEVASLAYSQCEGIIVFGVSTGPKNKLVLNPGDTYICVGGESVFVIAKSQAEASAVTYISHGDTMPLGWRNMQVLSPSSLVRSSGSSASETSITDGTTFAAQQRRQSRTVRWNSENEATEPEEEAQEQEESEGEAEPKTPESAVVSDVRKLNFSLAPIVVCVTSETIFLSHLEYLIGPLRVRALQQYRPVVIISEKLPEEDNYESFSHFTDVHFVLGSPFQHKTLRRAGVADAHRIVIMGVTCAVSGSDSELLQDAASIALHKSISTFVGPLQAPRIVTELVNRANVHFVAQNLAGDGWFPAASDVASDLTTISSSRAFSRNFFVSPAFTSGLTYSTSLCDNLLINQFFNARIKSILREFMFSSWTDDGVGTMAESPAMRGLQRSSLFTVEVPMDFVGRSFEYVFHYLLSSDDILVIGLYRCHPDSRLAEAKEGGEVQARIQVPEDERSVPFGYVYVNPQPFEVITGHDLLYVLSDKQPCWADTPDEEE